MSTVLSAVSGPLPLSKIILGTAEFGCRIPEEQSFRLMDRYFELGGNTLDTAAVYGDWEDKGIPLSEITIGKWMRANGNREQVTLITKGAHYRLATPNIPRVSAACIHQDVEQSLNALQTNVIDLYFLHRDDPTVPVEELMNALDIYVKRGNIRALGASNWTAERIAQANAYALSAGKTPFSASQIRWSLAIINPEWDPFAHLPHMDASEYAAYQAMNMPILAWTSQAGGVLTRMLQGDVLDEETARSYDNDITKRRAERLRTLCAQKGITPTQGALAYITSNPLSASALVGTGKLSRLDEIMSANGILLTPEEIAFLEA